MNFVATLDGRATIEGRSGPIGDQVDREIFHGLRTQADAIMVGANTLMVERYAQLVKSRVLAGRREQEGLDRVPLAVVVSGALSVDPVESPLLQDAGARAVIITGAQTTADAVPAQLDVITLGDVGGTLDGALRKLREEHGVRSVLCEGGPTLFHALLAEDLVDELFLSLSPKLVGGDPAFTIVAGAALAPADLSLITCHEAEDSLYLRYAMRRG
jgi:riboflavin-specific deaminase-like protein